MAAKYQNPPIIESVFEIVFEAKEWNGAIPGLFYSKIQADLPSIQQENPGMQVVVGKDGVKLGGKGSPVVSFKNKQGSSIVRIAPNLLSVHDLPNNDYKGWDQFAKLIHKSVAILTELVKFNRVNRYSISTINKFDIGIHSYENLCKYLNTYPVVPNTEFDTNSIQMIFEQPMDGGGEILVTKLVTIKPDEIHKAPVVLELSDVRVNNSNLEILEDWLEGAHSRLINNFEKSLTETAKANFNNG
jgi:uncharacterized protein (TIGR04255 family)